jgi:hypothetical protein
MSTPTDHPEVVDLSRYFRTITEAAAAYGISTCAMQTRIKLGKVPSIKVGWSRLVEKPADEH